MIGIVVDGMNRYTQPQEFYTLRFPLLAKLDWNYILDDKLLLFPWLHLVLCSTAY